MSLTMCVLFSIFSSILTSRFSFTLVIGFIKNFASCNINFKVDNVSTVIKGTVSKKT